MQVFKRQYYLCTIESGLFLAHVALLFDVEEQIASVNIIHDKVQVARRLEGVVQVKDERVSHRQQHLLLAHSALYETLSHDVRFADGLHGIKLGLIRFLVEMLHQEHLGEGSFTNHLANLPIFYINLDA